MLPVVAGSLSCCCLTCPDERSVRALVVWAVTGIVVLNGWTLGIIESVIFSCAIGMACDFVAHLGFAYRQANNRREGTTREELVGHAIVRISPAITAAALSTGLMGFLMIFSATTFNQNFGFFILLLMSLSWAYAVFCLLPLLAIGGPLGECGIELPYGKLFGWMFKKKGSGQVKSSRSWA